MNEAELKRRTFEMGLRTLKLCEALPKGRSGDAIARQLVRSATSVGANYRAACRAKSRKDFVAKLAVVEEECDETLYWLEIIESAELMPPPRLAALKQEAEEILRIVVASIRTSRM